MANILNSPADIVNAALVRLKKTQIGNLYDGSAAAKAALSIYGQERDALLRMSDWDFAMRSVSMTLLKTAPANYIPPNEWNPQNYPPLGWAFEYAYPDDCLKVRIVKAAPAFQPNFNPGPNLFQIANDNAFVPPQRVILCNVENAILTYTARVTNPLTWAIDFTEALIGKMAERLADNPQMMAYDGAAAASDTAKATMEQG